jgi:hypothetical protein
MQFPDYRNAERLVDYCVAASAAFRTLESSSNFLLGEAKPPNYLIGTRRLCANYLTNQYVVFHGDAPIYYI